MKKFIYLNLLTLAMLLFSLQGTAQDMADYNNFDKPKAGNSGNKRRQIKAVILNAEGLATDSPTEFTPTGSKTNQEWSNYDNEIKAYPGANFDLKVQYQQRSGFGSLSIFQLRSDVEPSSTDKIYGIFKGDWQHMSEKRTETGNNKIDTESLFMEIEEAGLQGVSVEYTIGDANAITTATFPITIHNDIKVGQFVVIRFIICKITEGASFDENPNTKTATELSYCDYIIRIVRSVKIKSNNPEWGTVSFEGAEGDTIESGGDVTVIANPKEGYRFVNWTKDGTEVSTETKFTYNEKENATLVANFEKQQTIRTITVVSDNTTMGNVSIENHESTVIETADPVTVSATANIGYEFVRWTIAKEGVSEVTESTDNPYIYTDDKKVTLTAYFQEKPLGVNNGWKTVLPSSPTTNNKGYEKGNYYRIEINDGIFREEGIVTAKSFTIESWVKFDDFNKFDEYSTNKGLIVMGNRQPNFYGYDSEPSFGVILQKDTEGYKLKLQTRWKTEGDKYNSGVSTNSYKVETSKWYHIAYTGTVDPTNNNLYYKLYVNGEEVISYDTTGNVENALPVLPDKYNDETCTFAFGEGIPATYSDIMIWNKVLTPGEIRESMKGYVDAPEGLYGYYLLDKVNDSGECQNLGSQKGYTAKIANITLTTSTNATKYIALGTTGNNRSFLAKTDVESKTINITEERPEPRGGAKFYNNNNEIIDDTKWEKNGNETFGYLTNTGNLKRLDYNGETKVLFPETVLAVYHNGNPSLPTYVKNTEIKTNTDLAVPQIQNSYVAAGLEYTMTMPSTAKTEWMPISLPENIDLVSDGTYILRPGYNFWYAQVKDDYTSIDSENGIWETVTSDTENYELEPGIISVPEARTGQSFTFYTKLDVPVVIRSFNSEFNKTLMPKPGTIKYIRNPYSYEVNSLNVAGIYPEDGLNGESITVYKYNSASGNFDPVSKEGNIDLDPTNRLKAFEPFFVHDSNNGVSQAPRYIGTKDVSGIVEFEAVYDVNVRGTENAVEVETFQNTGVQIYTLDGVMVAADEVEGTREFELPAGIYVVKTTVEGENKSFKVVVE